MADGLTAEQIAARPFSIGSSDAAAALGLVTQRSPLRVWEEKRLGIELAALRALPQDADVPMPIDDQLQMNALERELRGPDDLSENEAVELGTLLEDDVAELFERRTGKRLFRVNNTIVHPRLPFMTCNIDRRVVGEPKLAEIKTAGFWAARSDDWGEVGTDAVPFKYAVQVQHQLACLPQYESGYVPLLVAGQNFRLYEVQRDAEIIGMLEAYLTAFWQSVIDGVPPTPTTLAQAQERWPKSVGRSILATDDIVRMLGELKETTAARLYHEKEEKRLKGEVAIFMEDADTLMSPDGSTEIATYKLQERAGYVAKATSFRVLRTK
jgi:putative phage-type endonuclease